MNKYDALRIEGDCDMVVAEGEPTPAGAMLVRRMAWHGPDGLTLDGTQGTEGFPVVLVYL
jgi:hypothetical protein